MKKILLYISIKLLMTSIIVLTVLFTGAEIVQAASPKGSVVEIPEIPENREEQDTQEEQVPPSSGVYTPANQKSTTVEEIKGKINSMTSMPPTQSGDSILSATYAPSNNLDEADDTSSLETSYLQNLPFKSVKQYMSPIKLVLIIFLADLLLLGVYFFYSYQKPGRKIQ